MKRSILLLMILSCIYALFQFPYLMVNPGELLEGHKKIKDDCNACHTFFKGLPSEKCIACHKLSEIGISPDSSSGRSGKNRKNILFHQQLAGQECISCHTDHEGTKPGTSIRNFSHEALARAVKLNCAGCHASRQDSLHTLLSKDCGQCHQTSGWKPANFDHAMLKGSITNCLSCHRKPTDSYHDPLNDDCIQCHRTEKWKPSTFEHSKYFALDNNHNAECKICHFASDFRSYTCYGCHEHSENRIAGKHNEEGIYNFGNCVSCHRSGNEHEIEGSHYKNEGSSSGEGENHNNEEDDDD